jgi:hypothetical protein
LENVVVGELDRNVERNEINLFLEKGRNEKALWKYDVQCSFGKKQLRMTR